jgi:hypothetical protein
MLKNPVIYVDVGITGQIDRQFLARIPSVTDRGLMYKAKVAVCSEIRTKRPTQREHHVDFLKVKPGGK